MMDNNLNTSIKFRQNDNVLIVLTINIDIDIKHDLSHIIIGPLIDRVNYNKCFYAIKIEDYPDYHKILKDYFTQSYISNHEVHFTTKYKVFKKYFKITYARELPELLLQLSDQDLVDDLDFMKSEIINCQINMNVHKQNGNMMKYAFYDDIINKHQHIMFQIPTNNQYMLYLDKISLILDQNIDIMLNKEKQIMNDVMDISNNIW